MPGLSNEELRLRLEAHNYQVPPITPSTKGILLKKLSQLDAEKSQQAGEANGWGGKRTVPTGNDVSVARRTSRLIDYSSAEDEQGASGSFPVVGSSRRRASTSSRNSNSSCVLRQRSSRSNSSSEMNGLARKPPPPPIGQTPSRHRGAQQSGRPNGYALAAAKGKWNFSEEEGSDNEEEEEEESGEEDDESEEEEEDVADEEEEDLENDDDVYDRGVQTSPGLDDTDVRQASTGRRFMSSTPAPPVKNTSSYLSPAGSLSAFSHDSPLRRGVAANKQAFGSLGEVLATLPAAVRTSHVGVRPPESMQQQQPVVGLPPTNGSSLNTTCSSASSVATQATPSRPPHHQLDSSFCRRPGFPSSQTVSKITLIVAGLFFLLLSYKYANLRPSPEIAHRIPVCGHSAAEGEAAKACVEEAEVGNLTILFKNLVKVLERDKLEKICSLQNASEGGEAGMTVREAVGRIREISLASEAELPPPPTGEDAEGESEEADGILPSRALLPTMGKLLPLMEENPTWGVEVVKDADDDGFDMDLTTLIVSRPPVDWCCWTKIRFRQLMSVAGVCLVSSLYLGTAFGLVYAAYRLYVWRQEKRLREHQDVFELVEQVLSLLVTQHQLNSAQQQQQQQQSPNSIRGKPCLAISHIRDQLIPPQDRKRKRRVWDKVVKYIRDSESRVREDVKTIYGEEHSVWQWVPDIQWSPMNLHGPNPYVVVSPAASPSVSVPTTSGFLPPLGKHLHSPIGTPSSASSSSGYHSPAAAAAASSSGSPMSSSTWQGAAFNSLNRNVASPMVAPTSCLKVRHMFGQRQISQPMASKSPVNANSWVWQVKEEILRRCSSTQPPAVIHHIAVDLESAEGCVYIKAKDTEEAGKVFGTLHGQWYRGNLVTVKYLREERYYERFPDAKHHKAPLRPNQQQGL